MKIASRLIHCAKPKADTITEIQRASGVLPDKQIGLLVFETTLKDKKIYCCWSGGAMVEGQPELTLIGRAALEALINLPFGDCDNLIFQELKLDAMPVSDKVKAAVLRASSGAKICFVGDMQGELDGEMQKALNFGQEVLDIAH